MLVGTLVAVLFQFGGLTTLGVNTVVMALPGLVSYLLFGRLVRAGPAVSALAAFSAGALAVLLAGVLVAAALLASSEAFGPAAATIFVAHLPVMVIEGTMCAMCVAFLRKVKPDMLPHPRRLEAAHEG